MASAAVGPLSTALSTSSRASRAPGIFRSASWARIRSLRERAAAFTVHLPRRACRSDGGVVARR